MINTLDITISGFPDYEFELPNGNSRYFHLNEFIHYWHPYKGAKVISINLVNVESFIAVKYPLVNIKITPKKISTFKKLLFDGWNDDKLYDIAIDVIGIKDVTAITMRSGQKFIADESVDCIKNAIDACIWDADIKFV